MAGKLTWALASTLILTACGGGSTSEPAPTPPNPATQVVDVSAVAAQDTSSALPSNWYRQGAFMEIFVRSYADSNGDGYGDLKGLTSKLDYLKDLGVVGLWLMPIHPSYDRDHGYAINNFRGIEADYGTLDDFKTLVSEAHKRGIGIILDYAMDTSAASNPLFLDAKTNKNSFYRDWYVWQDSKPKGWLVNGVDPWYSSDTGFYFSGYWEQMPDFNLRNPKVEQYHLDNMRYWLNLGVDGFRYDSAGMLYENGPEAWYDQPENLSLIARVKTNVNQYSQRFTVCEAPFNPTWYVQPCGSAFGFGLQTNIINAAKGVDSSIQAVANYFKTASADTATFLSNHDTFAGNRLYTQFNGDLQAYRMATATYLTLPGVPFVYYGEEIGMANGEGLDYPDKALRTPMSWNSNSSNAGFTSGSPYRVLAPNVSTHNVASESADAGSLLNFYKTLLQLRKTHPALANGDYQAATVTGKVLAFQRRQGSERLWIVLNYGQSASTVSLTGLSATATLPAVYPSNAAALSSNTQGQVSVSVPAQSMVIFQLPGA